MPLDEKAVAQTRGRYERIAPLYDLLEIAAETKYLRWRKELWSLVRGPKVLEVGVGTGKNMPFYPESAEITGVDLTPGMLARARKRASKLNLSVTLEQGDVQALDFPDASFDDVVATFVFCSVPDPILGLNEVARVLKPGGRCMLLDHVRSANRVAGAIMDAFNPFVVRVTGANINRHTVDNVRRSNLQLVRVKDVGLNGIYKFIVASKGEP